MLTQKRQDEILAFAEQVNAVSENYQLVHATFAIEEIFRDHMEAQYNRKVAVLHEKLEEPGLSAEEENNLIREFVSLQKQASKRHTIRVNYIPHLKEDSARITKTQNNTFLILLPKIMENTRQEDGKINIERLGKLRKLMAHELAHIVLHSDVLINTDGGKINEGPEEEAALFADHLISLRKKRNSEIYDNQNFQRI